MASSPEHVISDSESDDGFNLYSGAVKRFKKTTAKSFQTGVIKLVNSPKAKRPKLARRSPSPEKIDIDSSDEEVFRQVKADDNKDPEDSNLDQSATNEGGKVATLEDVAEYLNLSPDVTVAEEYKRSHSSNSVTIENDVSLEDPLNCSSIDISKIEEEEDEMFVAKVRFIQGKVWRIEIKRGDYFKSIVQQLAEKTGVDENKLKLYHNDTLIDSYDTLQTVPLKITDILDAVVADDEAAEPADSTGMLELKIQGQSRGAVVIVSIRPQDQMRVLMQKYADATSNDLSKLVFNFDGEQLSPDDTPEMLDLEGGECIDVHIRN